MREVGDQAARDRLDQAGSSQLRQQAGERIPDLQLDGSARSALARGHAIVDDAARARAAGAIAARGEDAPGTSGLVTRDFGLAAKMRGDRPEGDGETSLGMVSAGLRDDEARNRRRHRPHVGEMGEHAIGGLDQPKPVNERIRRFEIGGPHLGGGVGGVRDRHGRIGGHSDRALRSHRAERRPAGARERRDAPLAPRRDHFLHRRDDADVSRTTAEIAAEADADRPIVREGETQREVARADHHARRAIAALQRMISAKRLA